MLCSDLLETIAQRKLSRNFPVPVRHPPPFSRPGLEYNARLRVKCHILQQCNTSLKVHCPEYFGNARLRQGPGQNQDCLFNHRRKTSISPKCTPDIPGRKKGIPKNFLPVRAAQKKVPEKPEKEAEIRFQSSFVFIVRKNSFLKIKYGEETGFGSWNIFKWLTVLYVDPQNLMKNRRNPSFLERVSVPREKQ